MKKRLEHRFAAAGAEENAAPQAAGGFDGSDGGYGRRGMPRLGERAVDVEEDGAVIVHGGFLPSFLVQFFPYYRLFCRRGALLRERRGAMETEPMWLPESLTLQYDIIRPKRCFSSCQFRFSGV